MSLHKQLEYKGLFVYSVLNNEAPEQYTRLSFTLFQL